MSRLIDLYATQVRILWDWRGGPVGLFKRLAITALVAIVSFAVTAWILPGIRVDTVAAGILAVTLIALFNALIRPVILLFIAPRSLILTAIVVLVLQVAAFYVVATLAPGVHVDRVITAVVGSFLYAAINTALTAILGVDAGGSYYGTLVQSLRAKTGAVPSDKPGLVIVQIDGLAHPIVAARIRAGSVTTMSSWVRGRTHKLSQWEALLPSMTSASQLGILHGNNDGLPAFRWFERDTQTFRVSSKPADAAELVRRASNGEGLLSNDGVSICNLVTGDATRSYLTTAGLVDGSRGLGDSKAFYGFFLSPSGYLRSITLFLAEVLKERYQARRTRRRGIAPQMHRGMKYAGMRAASNVLLRDINVSLIIEEMYRGANVIYADFTDYDELAHHCGPERVESFEALDGVDAAIGTLAKAAEDAPRPYRFVVLSDHGQSLGATFKQRYGETLGDLVLRLMGGRATLVQRSQAAGEGSAFLNAFLSEITRSKGAGASVARLAFRNRTTTDGTVDIDAPAEPEGPADPGSIAVVGSGNLGLVYFTGHNHRLTIEELEELHPGLVEALAEHPGVSFVQVRSAIRGGMAIGARGVRFLDDGRVEGEDPTASFGPHVLDSLRREEAMVHAADLLLISQHDPELGEVAAFEELIGSHGGLGGMQTKPFILHPVDWELDEPVPLGAPAIYRNLRRWLSDIGIELGRPGTPAASASTVTPPVDVAVPVADVAG
jgi:uncharacterized membrane protein YvlD (DUF360 family)